LAPQGWVPAAAALAKIPSLDQGIAADVVTLLALPLDARQRLAEAAHGLTPISDAGHPIIPVAPRSFRDFMLYEAHAVAASRGFVRRLMPAPRHFVGPHEAVTRRTLPSLQPHAIQRRN